MVIESGVDVIKKRRSWRIFSMRISKEKLDFWGRSRFVRNIGQLIPFSFNY